MWLRGRDRNTFADRDIYLIGMWIYPWNLEAKRVMDYLNTCVRNIAGIGKNGITFVFFPVELVYNHYLQVIIYW